LAFESVVFWDASTLGGKQDWGDNGKLRKGMEWVKELFDLSSLAGGTELVQEGLYPPIGHRFKSPITSSPSNCRVVGGDLTISSLTLNARSTEPEDCKRLILATELNRHSCGYYLAEQGLPTRDIQEYLGHKNIQHTVRYTAANPARFDRIDWGVL
jgi:hypothetical protein